MKAYELLNSPEKWTQRHNAKDKEGFMRPVEAEDAVCWCAHGALLRCYKGFSQEFDVALKRLMDLVNADPRWAQTHRISVGYWNDHATYEEVRQALIDADV